MLERLDMQYRLCDSSTEISRNNCMELNMTEKLDFKTYSVHSGQEYTAVTILNTFKKW